MSRRGNGEGSVYLRADGRWCAAVVLPAGERQVLYARTRAEAAAKLAAALHARQQGLLATSSKQATGVYLTRWLEQSVKRRVRPLTYAGYEAIVRLHLVPGIGHVQLGKLTPNHVQELLNRKLKEGHAPKHATYMRQVLRTALDEAQRWGLVSRNVAQLVARPRPERIPIRPLTPTEARTFLAAIIGHRREALFATALSLGLRQGEALGLRWEDVDLETGALRVRYQLQRINHELKLVQPKTERSRRTLALPKPVIEVLQRHRITQLEQRIAAGAAWQDRGLVFTTGIGTPLQARSVITEFHEVLRAAGLPDRRFHDLRHSCATLLLVQGVSPRVVMDVLGHSEIGTTMNTYSHVLPELQRDAADRMAALLAGSN